jgi:hypothetical protein
MLRTHGILEAYYATLWWRWLVFSFFQVLEQWRNEIDRGKPKYSGQNLCSWLSVFLTSVIFCKHFSSVCCINFLFHVTFGFVLLANMTQFHICWQCWMKLGPEGVRYPLVPLCWRQGACLHGSDLNRVPCRLRMILQSCMLRWLWRFAITFMVLFSAATFVVSGRFVTLLECSLSEMK